MTFDELAGLEYLKTPHEEFYTAVVKALGYEELKRIIPCSIEEIKNAFAKCDKHLNTLKHEKWVYASGFNRDTVNCHEKFFIRYYDNPMRDLYHKHGITAYSPLRWH